MKTYSFLNKTFVVLLCSVLAFVCVARPLQARADSASMDYVETDLSTSDVKALFTGASAIVPAAIMIIGFIVMCYCVLRNVDVPLQFDSQTSFNDKLTQLGQYAIDNATDDIKDFLYSVYTYCDDNGITSVLGLSKFVALQAAKFFGAITNWIGGSLINNRTSIGAGLIDQFVAGYNFISMPYDSRDISLFNSYSSIPVSACLSFVTSSAFSSYSLNSLYVNNIPYDKIIVAFDNGFAFYNNDNGILNFATELTSTFLLNFAFNSRYPSNATWSASNFTVGGFQVSQYYFIYNSGDITAGISTSGLSFTDLVNMLGSRVGVAAGDVRTGVPIDNVSFPVDLSTPASDNVYVPSDVWTIDIVGTWEQIAASQEQIATQTDKIAAFVGSIPLTLTAADSYAPTVNEAGNYVFPDFGSVWKYPQYFFDTLSGWGMFVGNCLRAVTVDEGGLSWIFYGGFVLLVCGGIIGKILMG